MKIEPQMRHHNFRDLATNEIVLRIIISSKDSLVLHSQQILPLNL